MPTLNDSLTPISGAISRESESELVVVLPARGKFIVLNGTGAETFRLMDGQRTLDEIAALLSERYDVALERTRDDVLALAGKLLDRGAVCRSAQAAPGIGADR